MARRIAVAATAPFGADVLERLAAEHDVAQLLTRPDKPRGRGRKLAAPPAKAGGRAARHPGRAAGEARRRRSRSPRDTVVVCAYGLLIPNELLERALWLNVHPVAAAALARRRSRRARADGRATTRPASRSTARSRRSTPGPIAAQDAFAVAPDDDAGAVYARSAEIAAELLDDVLAQDEPRFEPQPEEGATYAEKIGPEDRELDPDAPAQELVNRVRALSPHIGARVSATCSSGRRAWADDGSFEPLEVQPAGGRRMAYDAYLRGRRDSASPARRAAYEVLLRVFEQDAYADRAFRSAAEGLDERERAFAQRLAYGSVQRVRTLDHAIETLGQRPVRKLDPPVRAALRLGAYQLGYTDTAPHAAVNESVELVRRARLERAVPFTNAVMRRLSDGIRPLLESLPDGPLKESYPDWIHEMFVRVLGARRRARV